MLRKKKGAGNCSFGEQRICNSYEKNVLNAVTNWEALPEPILPIHKTLILGIYIPNEDILIAEKDKLQGSINNLLSTIGDQREFILMI